MRVVCVSDDSFRFAQLHLIDTTVCGTTVGALHALNQDPAFATARCIDVRASLSRRALSRCSQEKCVVFKISADNYNRFLLERPDACRNVVCSLALEVRRSSGRRWRCVAAVASLVDRRRRLRQVRRHTRHNATPLLQQQGAPLPVVPVAIAATIDSFFRAAMNTIIVEWPSERLATLLKRATFRRINR